MQGMRNGGTGKSPRVFKSGLFEVVSTCLNADAVVAAANLVNEGTLMGSSSLRGTSWKPSSRVIPITVVDFWNPTRATSDGFGSRRVLPRFVM